MFKSYWHSFLEVMGSVAILFTVMSLIFPDVIQFRFLHLTVCFLVPYYSFSFFTFQLKLFSSRLWIRRIIVMSFGALMMVIVNYIFGYFRFEFDDLITFGISILIFIVLTTFAYYVDDKIEQQNLKLINQKLADKN